jgi:dTMP kinase
MVATAGLVPDLTILLDIAPEVGLARKAEESRNRFEAAFDLEFHERVREGFLELARGDPERWRIVDAARDPDAVFADVLAAVDSVR